MNTLTYKTQTEVEAIVRRFWGPYFGCMVFFIVVGVGLLYGSASMEDVFPVQLGFYLAGFTVLFCGGGAFFVIAQVGQNLSTKQVSNSDCEQLAQWMESHPEIQQHIERIRAERAVLMYDYGVMKDWVTGHEDRQRLARQEAACKQVHGIG